MIKTFVLVIKEQEYAKSNERDSKFPKINTTKLFQDIDKNGDKMISYGEWMVFWKTVKGSGYTESEIMQVLIEIECGKGWVGFQNVKHK